MSLQFFCEVIQTLLLLRYKLTVNDNVVKAEKATEPHQWYVWDHITIALLVEDGKVTSLLLFLTHLKIFRSGILLCV